MGSEIPSNTTDVLYTNEINRDSVGGCVAAISRVGDEVAKVGVSTMPDLAVVGANVVTMKEGVLVGLNVTGDSVGD
jgi:hypothetical protein